MALKTIVKVSNVTNLSDARYCAGMGVDMLGFSMDEDAPEYVAPKKFEEIKSWVAGVQIVGETDSTDLDEIERLVATYQPDILQVNKVTLLPYLHTLGRPLILRVDLAHTTFNNLDGLFQISAGYADYILLESKSSNLLDAEVKDALMRLNIGYRILLGVGVSAENVHDMLNILPIRGIALAGGDEERPGNKEFGELMDILEAIEED